MPYFQTNDMKSYVRIFSLSGHQWNLFASENFLLVMWCFEKLFLLATGGDGHDLDPDP
jgi:hypothetical protein